MSILQITELLTDAERLKQALNGLSQLAYTSNVPNKRQTQHVDTLQAQIKSLQQQLAVSGLPTALLCLNTFCAHFVFFYENIFQMLHCLLPKSCSHILLSSSLSGQDAERQHREVVSIYRTHLLSAAQVAFVPVFLTGAATIGRRNRLHPQHKVVNAKTEASTRRVAFIVNF